MIKLLLQIEQGIANYMQYKMGFSQTILMVEAAMPSKFDWQKDRCKRLSNPTMSRTAYMKRLTTDIDKKLNLPWKCLEPADKKMTILCLK